MGVYIFFASLTMLFAAGVVGFFVTRANNPAWRAGLPQLPPTLWVSTALLVTLSGGFEAALRAARRNHFDALARRLWIPLVCALAFLLLQTENWLDFQRALAAAGKRTLYVFSFYLLTGLHAAHVLGGLIPLAIVINRAQRREYSSSRLEGLSLCAQYWHFLGVIWLSLFLLLEFLP